MWLVMLTVASSLLLFVVMRMMRRRVTQALYRWSARLPCRLIKLGNEPYLERYYVGKWLGVTFYLHRFVSPDRERDLHNHPWRWARALVLTGGYEEERALDLCPHASESGCWTETRTVRWWNRIDGNTFHRISGAWPETWTLFFHSARVELPDGREKGWGFLEHFDLPVKLTVFQSYETSNDRLWPQRAPVGAEAGREPYGL